MPTVDDLVVSLTIKPTSNLGRLQKQLDSIVGKTGKDFRLLSSLMYLKKDLNIIKRQVKWLRPTVLPTGRQPKQLRKVAGTLLKDISELQEEVVEKLLKTPKIKTLMEEFGVKTTEELKGKMITSLEHVKETLGDIFEDVSVLSPSKREEVINTLDSLISQVLSKREVGLEFWRKISKFTPEAIWQSRVEEVFRAMGAKVTPQKPLYMVKPEALMLEEIQKKLGLGYSKEIKILLESFQKIGARKERSGEIRDIKPLELSKLKKILGLEKTGVFANVISEFINETLKSGDEKRIGELVEKIRSGFFTKLSREDVKNIGLKLVSKETANKLNDIVKKAHKWTVKATMGAKRVDLEVDNFKDIRKEIEAKIYPIGEVGVELKKLISRGDIEQLQTYMKYYGQKNVLLLGEQIATGVLDYARSLGFEENIALLPDIRKLEKKWEIAKPLLSLESEKFMNEFRELTNEIKSNTGDLWEKLFDPLTSTEERQKLFGKIEESKWKNKLLDKMEKLINAVSDYRNELKTTMGRGSTESEKLYKEF